MRQAHTCGWVQAPAQIQVLNKIVEIWYDPYQHEIATSEIQETKPQSAQQCKAALKRYLCQKWEGESATI